MTERRQDFTARLRRLIERAFREAGASYVTAPPVVVFANHLFDIAAQRHPSDVYPAHYVREMQAALWAMQQRWEQEAQPKARALVIDTVGEEVPRAGLTRAERE